MFESKVQPNISVPVTEGTVLTVSAPAAVERRVVIENLDLSNTLTWRWQFSDNGTSFADVAPDASLAPGLRVASILSGHVFYRLRASGNLTIAVKADAEIAMVAATMNFYTS